MKSKFLTVSLFFCYCNFVFAQEQTETIRKGIIHSENIKTNLPIENLIKNMDFREDLVNNILNDHLNLVDNEFKIRDYFRNAIKFWLEVYAVFDGQSVLVHDKENLGIVYDIINFSEIWKQSDNDFLNANIQTHYADLHSSRIKIMLHTMSGTPPSDPLGQHIYQTIIKLNPTLSTEPEDRTAFFSNLARNIRTQTGQKFSFSQGIANYLAFKKTLDNFLQLFDLPQEIMALPFLESSFNIQALSKVGAVGIWQFMPSTAQSFMEVNTNVDHRRSIIISTLGAFHLLKQSKQILKRWDLAITSYNSGTKHLILARKQLQKDAPNLEEILQNYNHPHMGFAVQNFFCGFSALAYALAYRDNLFDANYINQLADQSKLNFGDKILQGYLTKCEMPWQQFAKLSNVNSQFKAINSHLKRTGQRVAKGTIVFSINELPSTHFYPIPLSQYKKMYPKNLRKLVAGYNCSTK